MNFNKIYTLFACFFNICAIDLLTYMWKIYLDRTMQKNNIFMIRSN